MKQNRLPFISKVLFALTFTALFILPASAEQISISGSKVNSIMLEPGNQPLPGPAITVHAIGTKISPTRIAPPARPTVAKTAPPVVQLADAAKGGLQEQMMRLNFESAPIREVIKNIAEFIGMNYIIDDGVKGFVTIRTLDKIPASGAMDLLDQLLTMNNLSRAKVGDYWKFFPVAKALQEPLTVYQDPPATVFAAADRYQIQILTFNFVSAPHVLEVLKPFLSKNAQAVVLPRSNMLLLVERGVKLVEVEALVRALDVDSLDSMQVKLFELQYAFATDVAMELNSVYTAMGYVSEKQSGILFLPLERINGVLMVNPFPDMLPSIKAWIDRLDAGPMETTGIATFIYPVQNGSAKDLASILHEIYSNVDITSATPKVANGGKKAKNEISSSSLMGPVQIIAHEDTNTIIIRTARNNYTTIEETLRRLDAKPQQVLIEVLITELTLSDNLELGLEWAMRSSAAKGSGALNSGGLGTQGSLGTNLTNTAFNPIGGSGFSFFTRPTNNVMVLLSALAEDSKLDVRASPILMTSDNKTASIDITSEVPISTTSLSASGGEVQNIQYRSVGIRLQVTPKINEDNYVSLDINQEISQIDTSFTVQGNQAPFLLRRQAKTNVMIKDKHTLIIGGMINKQKGGGKTGVPFLRDIPILGWLFGKTTEKDSKTELLIMLTPHVINTDEDADIITKEYEHKIHKMQSSLKYSKSRQKK